jgi:hypothetical protein
LDIGDLLSVAGCVFQRRLTDFIAAAPNAGPVEPAVGKTRLGLEFRRLHVEHSNPLVPWSNLIFQRLQLDRAFREPGLDPFDLQFRACADLRFFASSADACRSTSLRFVCSSRHLWASASLSFRAVRMSASTLLIQTSVSWRANIFSSLACPTARLIPGSTATANSIDCVSPASFLAERLTKLA